MLSNINHKILNWKKYTFAMIKMLMGKLDRTVKLNCENDSWSFWGSIFSIHFITLFMPLHPNTARSFFPTFSNPLNNSASFLQPCTGCQEIDVPLPFECKIIMSPFLVTLWCCTSMEARQRLWFSERSLVPVCMCCCASSTGSFVRVLIYQKLQCRYGEGVHLFDTVQGCGSTWSG